MLMQYEKLLEILAAQGVDPDECAAALQEMVDDGLVERVVVGDDMVVFPSAAAHAAFAELKS